MRQRDLRKLVVETMMDYRYRRAMHLFKPKEGQPRRQPRWLSRYAEAEEIIKIVQRSKGVSKIVGKALSRFRIKSAELGRHT